MGTTGGRRRIRGLSDRHSGRRARQAANRRLDRAHEDVAGSGRFLSFSIPSRVHSTWHVHDAQRCRLVLFLDV